MIEKRTYLIPYTTVIDEDNAMRINKNLDFKNLRIISVRIINDKTLENALVCVETDSEVHDQLNEFYDCLDYLSDIKQQEYIDRVDPSLNLSILETIRE